MDEDQLMTVTAVQLDAQVASFLRQLEEQAPTPLSDLTPAQARRVSNPFMQALSQPPREGITIANLLIPEVPSSVFLRVYTPAGPGPFPILIFFHGGGWVLSTVEIYDGLCAALAEQAGCLVVSVNYRLAPEYKFPAGLEDCYRATQWIREHTHSLNGDAQRIVVGGDSAGGNLAAVVARLCRDRRMIAGETPLRGQLLLYPVTDLASLQFPSYRAFSQGYFLTQTSMVWFRKHYLNSPVDCLNPNASPLLAEDLRHLPPAYVLTTGFDVLRDEGQLYAARLQEAGNLVKHRCYDSMIHGFLGMDAILTVAEQAIAETATELRSLFSN